MTPASARGREAAQRPRACDACLRRAWLVGGLSERIDSLRTRRGSDLPRELLALDDRDLAHAVSGRAAEQLLANAHRRDPVRLREAVRGAHCWACCRHHPHYPPVLAQLGDPPAVLFGRGDPSLLVALAEGAHSVTVVGSRRPSAYGREMAGRLGRELAAAGLIVVSGMALGIDSYAHEGALAGGGSTIAVLGGGADAPTPRAKTRLYEQIVAEGLVLSELPPRTEPRPWSFPARNRIMAALAGMTVVVEARERSGSLITAGMAGDLGRDVGAVPGQVGALSAAGANALLREGAHLVRDAADVLDSMLGVHGAAREALRPPDPALRLDPGQRSVLEQVELGADSCDGVALACGISASDAAVALVELELEGLVRSDASGRYRRAADPGPRR